MFLDSSDSSGDGRDSVSVRSINMGYNEPFYDNFGDNRNANVNMEHEEPSAQVNLGFEDDGAVQGHVNKTNNLTIF